MSSSLLVQIAGGVGKHIAFTSLLPILKNKYEHIYLSTPYPDIYYGNSYVKEINNKIDKNFYKNVILKDNTKIVLTDPYDYEPFIKKKVHLLKAWAELCEIQIDDPMDLKTELYMTENEKFTVDKVVNEIREMTKDKFIMIQLNGGQSPHNFDQQGGNQEFSFYQEESKRHYPFDYYVELIKKLKDRFPEHTIVRYGLMNEPIPYEIGKMVATMQPAVHYKNYYWLSHYAEHIICIDSSLQHMTAGVKPSVVIWGNTKPEHFGYNIHTNLTEENEDSVAYCRPLGEHTQTVKFPSPDRVIESLK